MKAIDEKEYQLFLTQNHIQGFVPTPIRLGLFYNGELVSCIGIGKSRFKKDETELLRYCTKTGTIVVGGLSRLIKNSGIKDLISYVDLRYFDGTGYSKAGFELISKSKPGYIYIREKEILTRYQCQKGNLPKLLGDKFHPELTEVENMTLAGYYQLYDCGMLKFRYTG